MDEIYDNLESGLEAFKKLGKLISRFSQYNLIMITLKNFIVKRKMYM